MSLESIKEHNNRMRKEREERGERQLKTGVACPNCGTELRWRSFFKVTTLTTKDDAFCSECHFYTKELER